MSLRIFVVAACLAPMLGACGTIVRGTTEDVTIQTTPEAAKVTTSLGQTCPSSPCTFKVSRKEPFTAYAEKAGFKPGSIEIKTKVSGRGAAGFAGNVIAGGVIGMGVDSYSGATLDHYPNPAMIVLEPEAAPVAPKSPKKPKKTQEISQPVS